jgi:hypothetical protein
MVFDLITPMVSKLFEASIDQWNNKQSFKNIRLAVRDRLRREARLNAELLSKIKGKTGIIDELTTKALREVFEMPIPISKILDKNLDQNVMAILTKNKNYNTKGGLRMSATKHNWLNVCGNVPGCLKFVLKTMKVDLMCIMYASLVEP